MALFDKATEKTSGGGTGQKMEAPLLPNGGYPAILSRIIDLGEQPGSPQYPDPSYKMALVFECLDEFMVDEEGKEIPTAPREFDFEVSYNLDGYMSAKSKLHGVMAALEGFEKPLKDLLGTICTIALTQKATKKDAAKFYNAITAISAMREKDQARYGDNPAILPTMMFSLDSSATKEEFEKISSRGGEWSQQAKIKRALSLHKDAPQLAEALGIAAPALIDHGAERAPADADGAFDEQAQAAAVDQAMGGSVPAADVDGEENPFD